MKLDPDLTKIAEHAGLYILLLIVLKYLYVDPVVRLLKKRDALTWGRGEQSKEMQEKLEAMRAEYKSKILAVRSDLEEVRKDKVLSLRAEAEKKIEQAKNENAGKLNKLRAELDEEIKSLRDQIPEYSVGIRKQIVESVLEGKVVRV